MPTSTLRALTTFDRLPDGHATFWVSDDAHAPHIDVGEFAIVDTTDRKLQHGEIYLFQSDTARRERSIAQAKMDRSVEFDDDDGPAWTKQELRGFRPVGEMDDGTPLFSGLVDGHYPAEWLEERILGRVVGVSGSPLGKLIEPAAGYADEDAANQAFDECEFLDIIIATGHEPRVCRGRDGRWNYCEGMTNRRYDKDSREREFAMREKEISLDRHGQCIAECVRRGLID